MSCSYCNGQCNSACVDEIRFSTDDYALLTTFLQGQLDLKAQQEALDQQEQEQQLEDDTDEHD